MDAVFPLGSVRHKVENIKGQPGLLHKKVAGPIEGPIRYDIYIYNWSPIIQSDQLNYNNL